jgi:predicted RNase H-like HicB family nuclease
VDHERRYIVIVEEDKAGGFVATALAFPGVVDQGDTEEEAIMHLRDALMFTIECMAEEGEELPESDVRRRTVREVELAV